MSRPSSAGVDSAGSYRGFDGHAWPGNLIDDVALVDGLAPISELDRLMEYLKRLDGLDIDLIYCSFGEEPGIEGLEFVGYDVGYYESEYLHYSVILNEVLYGSCARLNAFVERLNMQLLATAEADALELLAIRESIGKSECDLEKGEERLRALPIFAPVRRRR